MSLVVQACSRRTFLELAATTAVTAVQTSGAEKRPNILVLVADDHRWDALGCMGNTIIHTPELDRLASQGVVFDNHFTTTAICCASRASIMLGQYAGTHGINDFKRPFSPEQVGRIYPVLLKQAGYHIGFIGKFGVGATMPEESFDYWKGFPEQGFYFPNGPAGPHLTHIMRDQANEFLKEAPRDKPFCLSVSFKAPHVQDQDPKQYLPPSDTLSLYRDVTIPPVRAGMDDINRFPLAMQRSENRRRWAVRFATPELYQASVKGYYRLISGIDAAVRSIRETLSRLGLADNTIVVYTADHGIFNGEHGFAGKWYFHEESIRIPLIIYDPRLPSNARGKRRQAMTLNIDLQPTVLQLANLQAPPSTQGRSLVSLLREDEPESRPLWFYEHHFTAKGWIPSSEGIRTQRWKYVHYTDTASPFEELYDLENDSSEMHNLAGNPRFAKYQRALSRYWQTWRESLRREPDKWREPINRQDLKKDGLL